MNSLSWLIYGADVVSGLRELAAVCGFTAVIATAIALISVLASEGETFEWVSARLPKFIGFAIFFGVLHLAIPSRQTIYMIAASEAGHAVYQTPEAREMVGDLREVIAKQIKKLKDDK